MVVEGVYTGKPVLTLIPEAKRGREKLRSKSVMKTTAASKPTPKSQANIPSAAKARRERVTKAREWMVATWPEVFNVMEPKPLAIGIGKLIMAARPERISYKAAKAALTGWVRQPRYRKAIAAGGQRFSLTGVPMGDISASDQQHAAKLINTGSQQT